MLQNYKISTVSQINTSPWFTPLSVEIIFPEPKAPIILTDELCFLISKNCVVEIFLERFLSSQIAQASEQYIFAVT